MRHADAVQYNDNPSWGTMNPRFRIGGTTATVPFRLGSEGSIEITFQYLIDRPAIGDADLREELRRRLNEVPGILLAPEAISGRPLLKLAQIGQPGQQALLAVFDWFASELKGRADLRAETLS